MKRVILLCLSFLMLSFVFAADPPVETPKKLAPLMKMKLERSKLILEGLAMEDFDKIAANAQSLHLLSRETGWNVLQTEEYVSQSRDFRRSTQLIKKAAEDKDISRATLGYVAMTVRCVECHSYLREHRIILTSHHDK